MSTIVEKVCVVARSVCSGAREEGPQLGLEGVLRQAAGGEVAAVDVDHVVEQEALDGVE